MKKLLLLTVLSILFFSCTEDIEPKELSEDYEVVEYRILKDSTLIDNNYPIYSYKTRDYIVVDNKVVANYSNMTLTDGFVIFLIIYCIVGLIAIISVVAIITEG